MKLHVILPEQLYQRGAFLHFPLEKRIESLRQHHIGIVVNLCPGYDDELANVPGFEYHHLPMGDNKSAVLQGDMLQSFAHDLADQMFWQGKRVLTHCQVGRNRSTFMSALIVRELKGINGAEALQWVRQKRGGSTLDNKFIEGYLRQLPRPDR